MSNPTPAEPEPKTSSTIISVQQTTARVGDQAKIVGVEVGTVGGDVVIHFAEQAYEVRGLPNPFLGMQTFTYADHAKFGGRQQAIRETVAKLTVPDAPLSLLFVTGASGSGKSSFAQAGLLPALEHFYATLTLKWAVFRPSRQPVAAFGDALWRQLGLAALDPANLTPESFAQFLRDQTPARQVNVIVVDQFEEAFTQSEPQARDALFALLAALPPFAQARTHVIATMRADYLPELFAVPALFAIAKQGVELRVMSEAELSDAIQQPLRAAYPDGAKHFEPALVEHLARDAASEASYLPLLQVTLEEIWRKGSLTLGAYGNLTDAIKQRADKVLIFSDYESDDPHQARPPADQQTILDIFLDLVDPAPDDDARRDVRRRRAEDELTAQLPDRMRLADALIQARLLSVTIEAITPTTMQTEIDIIHESLLTNWGRLQTAITDRRRQLRQRARFEQEVNEWLSNNRTSDYLLGGVRLAEARELERRDDIALRDADARELLRQSVVEAEAEQRQKLDDAQRVAAAKQRAATLFRWLAIVAVLAFAVSAGLALYAVQQNEVANQERNDAVSAANARATAEANALRDRDAADTARTDAVKQRDAADKAKADAITQQQIAFARELAANAALNLGDDPELSLLLATRAISMANTTQTEDVLRQALFRSNVRATMRGHTQTVRSAAFSPSGEFVVSAAEDGTARVWDATSGVQKFVLDGHGGKLVLSAVYNRDGTRIVTAGGDRNAILWNANDGKKQLFLQHPLNVIVNDAAFNNEGTLIVSASNDGLARIWNVSGNQPLVNSTPVLTLTGHFKNVTSAAFSPRGERVVTSSDDGSVRVWDGATGKPTSVFTTTEIVHSAEFSPDGTQVVAAYEDGAALVWDVATASVAHRLRGHSKAVQHASYNYDGSRIVTAGDDGVVAIWEARNGQELDSFHGHDGGVFTARFDPTGEFIVSASRDQTVRVWTTRGRELTILSGHTDHVNSIAFHPLNPWLASASTDDTVRLWELPSGKPLDTFPNPAVDLSPIAFSPDGLRFVVGGANHTATVWDIASHQRVFTLTLPTKEINSIAYSRDGKLIATAGTDESVILWDANNGAQQMSIKDDFPVNSVAFSPDGNGLLTGNNGNPSRTDAGAAATLWDLQTGRLLKQFAHNRPVFGVAVSRDGQLLVTAAGNRLAHVWDVSSGQERVQLAGHDGRLVTAVFSPDGARVLTAAADNSARLWDTRTGLELTALHGHIDGLTSALYSGDGKYIATSSRDHDVRVYYAAGADLLALARTRVTRDLTCAEKVRYLHEAVTCR